LAVPDRAPAERPLWRRTFGLDLARSLPHGCVDTAGTTFAIFLAERAFSAPVAIKVLLVAAPSAGLLASLFVVQAIRRTGHTVNGIGALIWVGAALGFGAAAIGGASAAAFAWGVSAAMFFLSLGAPLLAQIYRDHYPDRMRGRLFSITGMLRALAAAGFSIAAGAALTSKLGIWPWLLGVYALCCILMAWLLMLMRPVSLDRTRRVRLFDSFRHVKTDAPFRRLLIVWMFLGLGNLLGMALFVEYLANPAYGFGFDAARVGWLTSTIPMLAFVSCVVIWGVLFDRANFYVVRLVINLIFILSIALYYFGSSYGMLCAGMAVHGVARAGGNVAWSLWVTKFASAERVTEYMSVHTFLTGIRGVLAPVIAFALASTLGAPVMAWLGIVLIVIGSLIVAPDMRRRKIKPLTPLKAAAEG
jgi:MFS family permease